jgi:hypothetical protein
MESSKVDLETFQNHSKAAESIAAKINDFEQKIQKKEAELRHVFEINDLFSWNFAMALQTDSAGTV